LSSYEEAKVLGIAGKNRKFREYKRKSPIFPTLFKNTEAREREREELSRRCPGKTHPDPWSGGGKKRCILTTSSKGYCSGQGKKEGTRRVSEDRFALRFCKEKKKENWFTTLKGGRQLLRLIGSGERKKKRTTNTHDWLPGKKTSTGILGEDSNIKGNFRERKWWK